MSMLAYLFWESAVSALCFIALIWVQPSALKLALAIGLNIALSALCATLLSFLRLNSAAAYLALAALFSALAILLGWRYRDRLIHSLQYRVRHVPQAMALWFTLGALLSLSIRPVEEVDSLYNLHYMMGWLRNTTTPYQFAYHYVPFWELSYLPGLALTHSDLFFWYNSLRPVLLLGLVLFLIARELDLPDPITIWTIPALLMFPHLWLGPSGVATIKNDMLYAAGFALAALALVHAARGKSTPTDIVIAALAAAFIGVKFSGPVVLVACTACLIPVSAGWIGRNLKTSALVCSVVGGFWMVTVGHYYFHNAVVYGSPVYPHQINVGPLHLPGTADLSYSSILYNLHDARLWRYFFLPEHGLSPAGVFFPLILPAILIGSAVVALLALLQRKITPLAVLALFQLVSWGIYFRSTYSASGMPGDLAFAGNGLNSLRYVEGPLLIGELCLVWALYKIGVPRALIFLALAAEAGSRFVILTGRAPDTSWPLFVLSGLALALLSLALRPRVIALAPVAMVAVCMAFGIYLVDRRRPAWLKAAQPLYLPFYEAPSQELFYLIDNEFSQQPCWHFPLLGHRLQHDVDSGSLREFQGRGRRPRYVAWTRVTPDDRAITLPGYSVVVDVPMGVLLERSPGGAGDSPAKSQATGLRH